MKYGDRIRLIHVNTKKALHSHAINYKHSGSSGQQQGIHFVRKNSNEFNSKKLLVLVEMIQMICGLFVLDL